MFFKFIFNNRGEVENTGESIQDAFSKGIEDLEKEQQDTGEKKEPGQEVEEKPQVDVEGYKGPERRAPAYAGERRREADKALEDPEHELDYELKEGEGKAKAKLSDLKAESKWINDNKKMIAGALQMREMASKYPDFGKAYNTLISKVFTEKGYDADFMGRLSDFFEDKFKAAEEKVIEKDQQIEAMTKMLDELDPDSAQYSILKNSIEYQKSLKQQLIDSTSKISQFEKILNNVTSGQKDFLTKQEEEKSKQNEDRISDFFDGKYNGLLNEAKKGGFEFIDEEEASEFERRVRGIVGAAVKGKQDMDDKKFEKIIQDSVKAAIDRTTKYRESLIIRSKKKPGDAPPGSPQKTAEATLEEMEKELAALEAKGDGDGARGKELKRLIQTKKENDEDPLKGKSIGETIADELFASS